MTVGISLTNGQEAVVVADSRVSSSLFSVRQSDSANKLGEFNKSNFHGVVFSTGEVGYIERGYQRLPEHTSEDLPGFIKEIKATFDKDVEQRVADFFATKRKDFLAAAELLPEAEKKEYIGKRTSRLVDGYENEIDTGTEFGVVAYDNISKRIEQALIKHCLIEKLPFTHLEVGSGRDGANFYFTTKLQGINPAVLTPDALLLFAMGAYCFATVNAGVGGTPKVALIDKDKTRILDLEEATAVANIASAYNAEYSSNGQPMNQGEAQTYMDQIVVKGNGAIYSGITGRLGVTSNTLCTMLVPYSSWQERANHQRFPQKK